MTASNRPQPTGFNHPHMTPRQAKWLFDLINSRIGNGPALQGWKNRYFAISNRKNFEDAITALKALPVLAGAEHKPAAATEPGLYRDPSDGTIYRLSTNKKDVSVYSEKSKARRIVLETGVETRKGLWKKMSGYDSRQALSNLTYGFTLLAEWQMTDSDKVEYVTGICNFCYRGLEDARSVRANYGPDCAKQHDLPWGD